MKSNVGLPGSILALLAAAALGLPGCAEPGKMHATTLSPSRPASKIAIGFIENRHGGYRPFPVKNFVDMLEFEFMEEGYRILDYSPRLIEEATRDARKSSATTGSSGDLKDPAPGTTPAEPEKEPMLSRSDGTSDLFPRKLRSIAGERGARRRKKVRNRHLTSVEIQKLSSVLAFDFFIQGAVGTSERNLFGAAFDEEEDSLIFLKIYNRAGQRVGAIRFIVDEKDYSRATFLTKISDRIVEKFEDKMHGTLPNDPGRTPAAEDPDPAEPGAGESGSEAPPEAAPAPDGDTTTETSPGMDTPLIELSPADRRKMKIRARPDHPKKPVVPASKLDVT